MNRYGYRASWCAILVAIACWAVIPGCATTSDDAREDDDEFIGQPPPPEDDPFSVRGDIRGEAVEATPQGEISEEDFEEPTPRDDLDANPEEWDEALAGEEDEREGDDDKPEPETSPEPEAAEESDAVASRTPEKTSAEEPEAAKEPQGVRCFSCVRICPLEGDCASAKKDVICGWGTHSTRNQAARLARVECDVTLDMARQMPVWSRIEGACPKATCSE